MRGNSLFVLLRILVLVASYIPSYIPAVAAAAPPIATSPTDVSSPWQVPDPNTLPDDQRGREVRLGRDLIAHTSALLGPDAPDPRKRYAGNGLDCASCHINAGTQRYGLPLAGIWPLYPAFSARLGKIETLAERINDCMQRSMNGRPLPPDGAEMAAMLAYLRFYRGSGAGPRVGAGPRRPQAGAARPRRRPKARADGLSRNVRGLSSAEWRRCALLFGRTGKRYVFPPLWGPDSYNDGAGMARNITAAWFVHANMPQGTTFADPVLSPGDAYDVAAYINQNPRPQKAQLDRDYPDRWLKPADAAFPPLLGPFSPLQHELGPWPPIEDWLKAHAPAGREGPLVD